LKYDQTAGMFYDKGFAFFSYDQRGHGRSDGKRVYVNRYADLLDDLRQFTDIAKVESLCENVYLLGTSMGGLTSLLFAIEYGEKIEGVIASAPALRFVKPPSGIEISLAPLLAFFFPAPTTSNRAPFEDLTHDAAVIEEQKADKLSLRIVSFKMFVEMTKTMRYVFDNASRIKVPALLLHGTGDKIVDAKATREFCDKMGSADKEVRLCDGLYHELLRETNRREIIEGIIDWISKRAGK
jgi:acylglycerol lipase